MHGVHAAGAGVGDMDTPEACRDISQVYAFFAYAWCVSEANIRTLKGRRGFLAPRSRCGC